MAAGRPLKGIFPLKRPGNYPPHSPGAGADSAGRLADGVLLLNGDYRLVGRNLEHAVR